MDFGVEGSGRDIKRARKSGDGKRKAAISSRVFGKIRIEVSGSESTTTEPSPRVTSHKCEVLKPVVSVCKFWACSAFRRRHGNYSALPTQAEVSIEVILWSSQCEYAPSMTSRRSSSLIWCACLGTAGVSNPLYKNELANADLHC